MRTKEDQKPKQELEQVEQVEQVEPIAIYKNNIYALVDDVKEQDQFIKLSDEELKNNKAFFSVLIDYIYNNYIGELLGNKRGKVVLYDINLLDDLFNIYIDLVYKYKWNNKPFIVEYSTFIGINNDTIYSWLNGEYKGILENPSGSDAEQRDITRARSEIVQKWRSICERELLNGSDTIRDIFILKAKHNYRDNNNVVEVNVNHKAVISADTLPDLIGINGNN